MPVFDLEAVGARTLKQVNHQDIEASKRSIAQSGAAGGLWQALVSVGRCFQTTDISGD